MLKTLAAACLLGALASAQAAPLAGLEEIYAVLDEPTARAAAASDTLRRFGGLQIRTTSSSEGHYRGLYLLGRASFLELFAPADFDLDHPAPAEATGRFGVGLATDRAGDIDRVKAAAEAGGLRIEARTSHKTLGGREVDWFRSIEPAAMANDDHPAPPGFEAYVVEYVPTFFDVPEAGKPAALGPDDVVSRARYHRPDYDAARSMRDVSGATLAVAREDWRRLRPLFEAAGYRTEERATGGRATGDATLDFVFVPRAHAGVRRVEFTLNRAPGKRRQERVGRSTLVVGPGAHASWVFDRR